MIETVKPKQNISEEDKTNAATSTLFSIFTNSFNSMYRCAAVRNNETENCFLLQDPKDDCCKIVLCDVEEHSINKMDTTGMCSKLVQFLEDQI